MERGKRKDFIRSKMNYNYVLEQTHKVDRMLLAVVFLKCPSFVSAFPSESSCNRLIFYSDSMGGHLCLGASGLC